LELLWSRKIAHTSYENQIGRASELTAVLIKPEGGGGGGSPRRGKEDGEEAAPRGLREKRSISSIKRKKTIGGDRGGTSRGGDEPGERRTRVEDQRSPNSKVSSMSGIGEAAGERGRILKRNPRGRLSPNTLPATKTA